MFLKTSSFLFILIIIQCSFYVKAENDGKAVKNDDISDVARESDDRRRLDDLVSQVNAHFGVTVNRIRALQNIPLISNPHDFARLEQYMAQISQLQDRSNDPRLTTREKIALETNILHIVLQAKTIAFSLQPVPPTHQQIFQQAVRQANAQQGHSSQQITLPQNHPHVPSTQQQQLVFQQAHVNPARALQQAVQQSFAQPQSPQGSRNYRGK